MHRYFIFYTFFLNDGSCGVGNMETNISVEITSIDEIKAIEKSVLDEHKDYKKVIVSNYIELPDLRKH